jgi:hypothetical protein
MLDGLRSVPRKTERIVPLALIGVAAPLLAALAMTLTFAAQETPAPAEDPAAETAVVGLTEILPAEAPAGLEYEDFSILDGNWETWGEETAEIVGEFYAAENQNVAKQRESLATIRKRLHTMQNSLADKRFRSLWNPLTTIHGRLVRRIDLAEAILDTLELTPEKVRRTQLEAAGAGVTQALRSLERKLQSISGGSAWLPVVKADEISQVMKDPADAEAALPVLSTVHSKLTDIESLGEAQKKFLSGPEFAALAASIAEYVKRSEEEHPPLDVIRLREELAQLVESVESYEKNGQLAAVKNVETSLAAIGKLSPDEGAQIAAIIKTHYQNYNFRIVASEEFLSRYVEETRKEADKIAERIQGAWVTGNQNTSATTAIDLRKSDNGGLFDLTLNGVVRTNTIAHANRANARIWTTGTHRFVARRSVLFDGDKFTIGARGTISVNASLTNTGASTSYDGKLFGASTARRRAMSVANARRPQSERIAADKIRKRVLPEFEAEVAKEFKQVNKDIEEQWNVKLREAKLEPAARKVTSTDKHLFWNSRIARPGEFSGGATTMPPPSAKGLAIHAHESLLNATFDRMNIAGRTMTDAEFRKEVDDYFAILFGDETDDATQSEADKETDEQEADADLYVFAAVDPIRFHIENGTVFLVIRTGIRRKDKDEIPPQKITVPLTFRLENDVVVIERGTVRVAPIARPKSRSEQIIRARVMGKKIENDLGNRTHSRELKLSRGEGKADLVLNITRITALNGWISIEAE